LKHPPIPLIRQAELRAPLDLLAAHGVPLGETLDAASLPERLQEPGPGFLPARQLLGFLALGARRLEVEDFAFRAVLRTPISHVGGWGERVPRCWRLRDALHCFAVGIVEDAPFLEAGVHYGADHAWLWRRRHLPPRDPRAERQGEQYTFGAMLRVVRAAAGPSWSPPAIRAESLESDWLLRAEGLGASPVRFGGRGMALAVPYDLLDRRLPGGTRSAPVPAGDESPAAATDLAGSLQQALTPLVGAVQLSLELAAEIAESSSRTLRRRLREEGTSFRGILERIRFEAAEERLREPTLSLGDIAAELGYTDQSNFARAFHRWTGESPGAYRRRRLSLRRPAPLSRLRRVSTG
jgi:AraC-like DNA-binding protein